MSKKKSKTGSIAKQILSFLVEIAELAPQPFEGPRSWIRRAGDLSPGYYHRSLQTLKKRGAIEVVKKRNKKFIHVTQKGKLELLIHLSKIKQPSVWDGKWRLVMFDIPEQHHRYRDELRRLLKSIGFKALQASVYICPYPLNRHAIDYLKQTGLIHFIRIVRVDECDDEKDLKAKFKLS